MTKDEQIEQLSFFIICMIKDERTLKDRIKELETKLHICERPLTEKALRPEDV